MLRLVAAELRRTKDRQRARTDNRLSMPVCESTGEVERVAYGEAPWPPNGSRTKDQRHSNGPKPELHRPQVSSGVAQEHISRSKVRVMWLLQ